MDRNINNFTIPFQIRVENITSFPLPNGIELHFQNDTECKLLQSEIAHGIIFIHYFHSKMEPNAIF
jgi:hypothetical protein